MKASVNRSARHRLSPTGHQPEASHRLSAVSYPLSAIRYQLPAIGHTASAIRLPPILCYHKIERRLELGVTRLSPKRFERQIERLACAGWTALGLRDIVACVRGERPVGQKEIGITFDDAYRGLRSHAFPVLRAHGFAATCFVITDYAGKLNRWDVAYGGRRFAHLAWRDMRAWQERGIEFASHTASHQRLTWLDERSVYNELAVSRDAITQALDVFPGAISYPFGAARKREADLAKGAGYDAGFTLAGVWNRDPMTIERLPVYAWSPPMPGVGMLASLEKAAAVGANRCAVGTSLWKALSGQTRKH
ncbi:MAG: polysaccharide deacetylase family protein [Anaerolineae bacterium]|nr:polysaccharide deacetylase family protein [Gemmatimonadaceae bacterium]